MQHSGTNTIDKIVIGMPFIEYNFEQRNEMMKLSVEENRRENKQYA